MAEGGVAAALANVDDRDSWRSTSPTPCAAASTSTTGAWPSCTPRRRPTACASSRPGARSSTARTDGRILQRNFGGHRYPRLAHVGDRTGLEMIRTLQDHGIHQGIDVHMEHTVTTLLQGRRPHRRRLRLRPRARPLRGVPRQGGGARHRRHRPRLHDHQQQLGVHRRRPRARLRRRRRAAWTWSSCSSTRPAWSGRRACAASWSPRACAARAACCATARAAASCSTTSPTTTRRRPPTTRKRAGATARATRTPAARPSCSPATTWRAASCARCARGAAARTAASSSTSRGSRRSSPTRAEHIKKKLPSMYHQFKQLADIDITKEPMEVGPTTHYMMGGVRVDAETQMSTVPGLFAAGECGGGPARRQPAGRQLALRPAGLRQARRRVRGARSPASTARRHGRRRRRSTAAHARGAGAVRARRARATARTPTRSSTSCRTMMQDLVGIVRTRARRWQRALEALGRLARARRSASASPATASTTPAGTRRSTCPTCSPSPRRSPAPPSSARRAAARSSATTSPTRTPTFGKVNVVVRKGADGAMQVERVPVPPLPAELQAIVEEMK